MKKRFLIKYKGMDNKNHSMEFSFRESKNGPVSALDTVFGVCKMINRKYGTVKEVYELHPVSRDKYDF